MGAVHALPALAPVSPPVAAALAVPRRLKEAGGTLLTFDDGPHPEGTSAVLGALERADARATFFLAGEQVERHPAVAAEVVAAGHDVALHCHRHRNQLRLGPRSIAEDMRRGLHAIQAATGRVPDLYRPPYGIFSAAGLAVVRAMGLRPLLWSRWGRDWRSDATAESIARELVGEVRPGDVLLLHDADHYSAPGSWRRTVAALPRVLEALSTDETAPVAVDPSGTP